MAILPNAMKRRAKRGRVAADMSGIELRVGLPSYAFQQTRFESKWQLLEFSDLFCSSKL